jgi:phosphoglycolate phosphatase
MRDAVNARRVVLFDIDGTLLDVRGAGRRSFARALTETWGVEDDLRDVQFAGATDRGVLLQLRRRHTLDEDRDAAFFRAMELTLSGELTGEPPHVFTGVRECLARLSADAAVMLGLVTGNALRCAQVKLERAGLDRAVFDAGGYGDEHDDRDELARLAVARARHARGLHGHGFARVLLVGDTPNDVRAARAIGAVAVAVTTGHFDRAALVAAGADVVLDDLGGLAFSTGASL